MKQALTHQVIIVNVLKEYIFAHQENTEININDLSKTPAANAQPHTNLFALKRLTKVKFVVHFI